MADKLKAFVKLFNSLAKKTVTTKRRSVFRNSAILSGLVTQEQIDRALQALTAPQGDAASTTDIDDGQLAEKLVELKILTGYQAKQLEAGRTKLKLGPYIITDWIGQGGMGQVYKAEHEMMGRQCAVKVLPLSKSTPHAVENFRREIRTQAKLDHSNLVRAYDAGEDGKVHYLVVEYVPGTDLRRLVRLQGRLTVQQAASIVRQAAFGLEHAHQCGLIHRDVKPGNILVTPSGLAKVSDLGLAGFMHESDEDPRKGKIVGTADYLAPEQIKSPLEIVKASDIYSLGCTLYYAITGKVPFPGGTASSKAMRHCEETPWHPRRFNEEISDEFVDIIADMMEKDPHTRIQSMSEVAARLEPWASESGPMLSQQMRKSPWMPPPLPTGGVEDDLGISFCDTGSAVYDPVDVSPGDIESLGQLSQGTNPVGSAAQDTRRVRSRDPIPPPLLSVAEGRAEMQLSPLVCVAITLAVAVPVSLLVGGIIGFILGAMFW